MRWFRLDCRSVSLPYMYALYVYTQANERYKKRQQAGLAFNSADTDGNDMINYAEFCALPVNLGEPRLLSLLVALVCLCIYI